MSDDKLFQMNTTLAIEVFDATIQKLKKGEITFEEANQIGARMPKGWNFQFEDFSDGPEGTD